MSQTSSANQTRVILVIGEVTSKQYEPARIDLIKKGFDPKIVRLDAPSSLGEKWDELADSDPDMMNRGSFTDEEVPERYRMFGEEVALNVCGVNSEHVSSIVLTDEHNLSDELESGLVRCGIEVDQWCVGLDGSPAYYIG